MSDVPRPSSNHLAAISTGTTKIVPGSSSLLMTYTSSPYSRSAELKTSLGRTIWPFFEMGRGPWGSNIAVVTNPQISCRILDMVWPSITLALGNRQVAVLA